MVKVLVRVRAKRGRAYWVLRNSSAFVGTAILVEAVAR